MIKAPLHPKERERMLILEKMGLTDPKPEPRFDAFTREAVDTFGVKISSISILTKDKELYKSCVGLNSLDGPRDISFCGHALLSESIFIVEDATQDERFKDNPYVVNYPFIKFYAGVVLKEENTKLPIGVFCIKDDKPRKFNVEDVSKLIDLAERAEKELNKK
jgi:GAF domain-containing protein